MGSPDSNEPGDGFAPSGGDGPPGDAPAGDTAPREDAPREGEARPAGDRPAGDRGPRGPRGGGGGRGRGPRGGGGGARGPGGPQGGGPRGPREGGPRGDAGPRPSLAPLAKLVAHLAKALVDRPDEVEVREAHGDRHPRIELLVAPDDIGKVIGKDGRTAQCIRALLLAAASRTNTRVHLEILD
jgi:predicted RNA-binding protein YlqC (UPF0109 family)